jgi:hypothetical protein
MMNNVITRKDLKLPKWVFLQNTSDFTKFEETLRTLCEKFLSHDWDWTFRVGGKVQREIEHTDPDNVSLKIIHGGNIFTEREDIFQTPRPHSSYFKTESKTEGKGDVDNTPRRVPPPPPPPPPTVSKGVAQALGKRGWEINKLKQEEDERFYNIHKNEFEPKEVLGIRKEIWDWAVVCVQGEQKNLFCSHLVREVDKWDIHQLFRNVRDFLHTENYKEYGNRLERYFTAQIKESEDIFTYISRLDKYREEIEHLEHLAHEAGETLVMPKFFRVWKILSAVERFPEYRVFTDKVQQMAPTDWVKLNPEQVRTELHKIHSNKTQLQTKTNESTNERDFVLVARRAPPPPPSHSPQAGGREGRPTQQHTQQTQTPRTPTPRKYTVNDQLKYFNCPEGVCLGYFKFGRCPRALKGKPCSFLHTHTKVERKENMNTENVGRSRSLSPVFNTRVHSHSPHRSHTPNSRPHTPTRIQGGGVQSGGVQSGGVCGKCGRTHGGVCLWSKRCFQCGGLHAAKVCRKNQTTTTTFGSQRERRNSV